METIEKSAICSVPREFYGMLPHDKEIHSYKNKLLNLKELKNILILRNQFFLITDIIEFHNIHVSDNIIKLLGYKPEDFYNMDFVYNCIHPDDRDFVADFSKKTTAFLYHHTDKIIQDPFIGVFLIDYRIKSKNSDYIRFNCETACFRTDKFGNMIYSISVFTDINHIRKNNLITYSWKVDFENDFNIDDLLEKYQNRILTTREKEIITQLSQGLSATQIGKKLYISDYTVIAHRRNILRKTGAKNTAELIKYAVEVGLI